MTDATTTPTLPSLFAQVATAHEAIAHFRGRLAFESDVSDVATALAADEPGFIVVDTRSDASWMQGRVPGAMHLPGRRIADEAPGRIPTGTPVVVYCWGPGCNGATRAALEFARLGHPVKEMLGGFEYWVREGFAYDTDDGMMQRPIDALTNAAADGLGGVPLPAGSVGGISCAC
jgi:rhodanese-related sulfurtransferase